MHKAARELRQRMSEIRVVVELRDARIPHSSRNPVLASVLGDKPLLILLTKSDLADPLITDVWSREIRIDEGAVLATVGKQSTMTPEQLTRHVLNLTSQSQIPSDGISILVAGVPNVGKSTFINRLVGKSIAKTGNEPAVTRQQQRLELGNGLVLFDTPGVLWPKVENPSSGLRLAATGGIRDTAYSHEDVGYFLFEFLRTAYPDRLQERFGVSDFSGDISDMLDTAGRFRGALKSGGQVDLDRLSKIVITDLREGRLGRVSLETPEMIAEEEILVEKARVAREKKRAERKQRFKKTINQRT